MKQLIFGVAYLALIIAGSALGTMMVRNEVITMWWQPIVVAFLSIGLIAWGMMR